MSVPPLPLPPVEDYILGCDAAGLMGVSMPTFKRYYLYGYHGVFLRTVRIGGKRFTTRDWIDKFIAGVTSQDEAYSNAVEASVESAKSPSEEIEAARDRLRAAGILEDSQ